MSRIYCKWQGFWHGGGDEEVTTTRSAAGAACHYNLRLPTEGLRLGHGPAALGPAPGFKGYRLCRRSLETACIFRASVFHEFFFEEKVAAAGPRTVAQPTLNKHKRERVGSGPEKAEHHLNLVPKWPKTLRSQASQRLPKRRLWNRLKTRKRPQQLDLEP